MKIDMTQGEIELLLMLLKQVESGVMKTRVYAGLSIQELSVISKLEAALRQDHSLESVIFDALKSSTTYH